MFVLLCRCHVIEQFNKGLYDYVIATDELPDSLVGGVSQESTVGKKRKRKDKEYSVSRGIDFQGLAIVNNYYYFLADLNTHHYVFIVLFCC